MSRFEAGPLAGDRSERAPLDLRLALPAAVAWLAALWALGRSDGQVLCAALTALGLTLVLGVAGSRSDRWYPTAAACCAVALVLLPLAARLHRMRDSPVARLAVSRPDVIAELTVAGDPRPLAARGTSGMPRTAVDARLRSVELAGRRTPVSGAVLVLAPADVWRQVLPGQRVRVAGRLAPPLPGDLLTAVLTADSPPQLLGRPPPWQRLAGAVRAGLQRASAGLPSLPRGLLPGLVDGDTSQLDPVLANRFRIAGLSHLTAVSGTNCSLLVGSVALLLRRLRASPRLIALVGLGVLVVFVLIARPSPSVLRAAVMAAIALLGLAAGRQRGMLPTLAASCLLLLVWQPELAANLGFALSVAATAALLLLAPGLTEYLRSRGVPPGLAEPLAVAASAHLITMPLIAGISGQISLVAIPANLLAEPVVAAATILGLLAALTSVLWQPIAVGLAQLAGWPCRWLVWVAEYFGSLPGGSVRWPAGVTGGLLLAAIVVLGCWLCRWPAPRTALATATVVALLVQIPVRSVLAGWPPQGWLIVACSVGQGDSLALNAGDGAAVVIDAGPDPVAADRCLHQLGIERVPLLVLTHFHLDHVGGLAGVLHQRQLGRVVTSPLLDPISGYRQVTGLLSARRISPQPVSAGTVFRVGSIRLDVLGPLRSYRNTRSDPNNSSVVLRATVAGERILLPGDAEVEAQDDLLRSGVDLRADILKVPHHGSAYSAPKLLQAVHARLALISVGLNNDYGHPAPTLLAELTRLGVPVRRTDLDGDVAVVLQAGQPVAVLHAVRVRGAAARSPPGCGRFPARGVARSSPARAVARSPPAAGVADPRRRAWPISVRSRVAATGRLAVGSSWQHAGMPSAAESSRPTGRAPLTLVVGDEEFLVSRALEDLRAAGLADDPETEVHDREAAAIDPAELMQLLSPSLFGGRRLLILRSAQDLPAVQVAGVLPMLLAPDPDCTVVIQHLGGAKGKAVLDAARKAKPTEISCARLTRLDERQDFLRSEVKRFGGRITADAATALLDAVGSDLREISAVTAQLIGDTGGSIDAAAVTAYHRGRAEVTGFAVADQAVVGNVAGALTNLRWALNVGVPAVVIADALADGVRTVAKVLGAGPGDPFRLAPALGMPPWKVKRARGQSRGWAEPGLRQALAVVAQLNADVKGNAADPEYALESAVRRLASARELR